MVSIMIFIEIMTLMMLGDMMLLSSARSRSLSYNNILGLVLTYVYVCLCMLMCAYVCLRCLWFAYVCLCVLTLSVVCTLRFA